MLIYHNITPPEYFLGVHEQLVRQCYHGRRELLPYRSRVRSGARRLRVQPAGARGARLLADRRAAGRARTSRISTSRPDPRVLDAYDDEWTNILFVGRVIPNKRPDNLIRFFHAYKTLYNPRSRLLLAGAYGGFDDLPRAAARAHRRARRRGRAHPRPGHERGADGALRRRRSLPVRERARGLLRAADRGVLQARAGARLRGDGRAGDDGWRRRAVRDARSAPRGGADAERRSRTPTSRSACWPRRTPRSLGCARRTSAR